MKKLRILAVDDDIDFARLMRMQLESWGHDVTVVHNWLSAMMLIGRKEFDVMLLDIDTPTGNGLTACSDLSSDQKVADTKKVFITGRSDPETVQRCRQLNAGYIHKGGNPFDQLRTVLEQIEPASLVEAS